MKCKYLKAGDYYVPTLTVSCEHYSIGKYGMLRREYLKVHRRAIYSVMLMNGTLLKYLADVDTTCHELLDDLIPKMAEREDVTETLKAADQMELVRRMNNIKNRVEEILYRDYVYGTGDFCYWNVPCLHSCSLYIPFLQSKDEPFSVCSISSTL